GARFSRFLRISRFGFQICHSHAALAFRPNRPHAGRVVFVRRTAVPGGADLMSTGSDNEFDLEKLFLPAWAQEPSSAKSYAKYEGAEVEPDRKRDRRGPRPRQREGGAPRGPGNRPARDRTEPPRQQSGDRRFSRGARGPRRAER